MRERLVMTEPPESQRPGAVEPQNPSNDQDPLTDQLVAIQSTLDELRTVLREGARELVRIRRATPMADEELIAGADAVAPTDKGSSEDPNQ